MHDALPQTVYDSRWHRQLMAWLASLTLEDEVRQDLGLPWVVCEYENVFMDELLGLPPHRDVDFILELHSGTSPISMTPHRMASVKLQELKTNYRNCWIGVLLDQALHLRALWFCLRRRRTRPFDCVLTINS